MCYRLRDKLRANLRTLEEQVVTFKQEKHRGNLKEMTLEICVHSYVVSRAQAGMARGKAFQDRVLMTEAWRHEAH